MADEIKIKNEKLFARMAEREAKSLGNCDCVARQYLQQVLYAQPSEVGRRQFFEAQSNGIKPQRPDFYYMKLNRGKWNFDWLHEEYRQLYLSGEWWGFVQLWHDWKGERWVLPYLCSWYEGITGWPLPEWIGMEITEQERQRLEDDYFKMIMDKRIPHKLPKSRYWQSLKYLGG